MDTQIKALAKMNTKQLRDEFSRVFGRKTMSKDPGGMRKAIAKELELRDNQIGTPADQGAAAARHDNAMTGMVQAAEAAEKSGQWTLAADLWTRAQEASGSKAQRGKCAGRAAAARVRAEASVEKGDGIDGDPSEQPSEALASKKKEAAPFAHDPRVLAKYPIGSTIELMVGEIKHEFHVRDDGIEYNGEIYRSLNTPVTMAKGHGKWNAYLVLGLDKQTPRAPKGIDLEAACTLVRELDGGLKEIRDTLPGNGWQGDVKAWLSIPSHSTLTLQKNVEAMVKLTSSMRTLLKFSQAQKPVEQPKTDEAAA